VVRSCRMTVISFRRLGPARGGGAGERDDRVGRFRDGVEARAGHGVEPGLARGGVGLVGDLERVADADSRTSEGQRRPSSSASIRLPTAKARSAARAGSGAVIVRCRSVSVATGSAGSSPAKLSGPTLR
jgi:hypothetical protein